MHLRRRRGMGFPVFTIVAAFGVLVTVSILANADVDPMSAPDVQRGKAQFQKSCAMCHGAGATGGIGPNLLESDLLLRRDKYGNLISVVIEQGRPDRGMPAFPLLTAGEVSDIVAFLRARVKVTGGEEPGAESAAELKKLLTGNVEAGKQYFNGQGKCASCHSPTGDLAGVAGKYSPKALEAALLYPRNRAVQATVSLSSGKTIKGKLLHLDAFYVSILDQDGWYRSWPLRDVKVRVEDPLAEHLNLLQKYSDKDIHDVFSYLETLK